MMMDGGGWRRIDGGWRMEKIWRGIFPLSSLLPPTFLSFLFLLGLFLLGHCLHTNGEDPETKQKNLEEGGWGLAPMRKCTYLLLLQDQQVDCNVSAKTHSDQDTAICHFTEHPAPSLALVFSFLHVTLIPKDSTDSVSPLMT